MDLRIVSLLATVATVSVASIVGARDAVADSTPAADFGLSLATPQPDSSTGLSLHLLFKNPSDASAKPSPQRKVIIELPAGARIDGNAVPACTASDQQIMLAGPGACPSASAVGSGTVILTTGVAAFDPFIDDVKLFNGGDGLIEVFNKQGSATTTAIGHRSYADPRTLSETPAPTPGGPPDGESAVRQLDYHLDAVLGPGGRPFITTPSSCPASGRLSSRLSFTTADGNSYQVNDATSCQRESAFAPGGSPSTRSPSSTSNPTCKSHRRFRIRLAHPRRARFRSIVVTINGRRTKLDPVAPIIDLRGLPKGNVTVKITATTTDGTRLISTRRYHTCSRAR